MNYDPADSNCVMDRHVVWGVSFDGVPTHSENFVWADDAMYQFASRRIDIAVCDWLILCN